MHDLPLELLIVMSVRPFPLILDFMQTAASNATSAGEGRCTTPRRREQQKMQPQGLE